MMNWIEVDEAAEKGTAFSFETIAPNIEAVSLRRRSQSASSLVGRYPLLRTNK